MDLADLEHDLAPLELLPNAIDRKAREEPNQVWARVAKNSQDLSLGFDEITYPCFANAINRTAWFLDNTLGKPPKDAHPTLAYTGASDVRYFVLTVAAAKVGYQLLLMHPSTSVDGQANLLDKSNCATFLYSEGTDLSPVTSRVSVKTLLVPELEDVLDKTSVDPYSYEQTVKDGLNECFLVLHTSGSTGLPKPVYINHGWMARSSWDALCPAIGGQLPACAVSKGKRFFFGFPMAHCGNVCLGLAMSVFNGAELLLTPSRYLEADVLEGMIIHGKAKAALCMPRALMQLVKDPAKTDALRQLDLLVYAGAPLPQEVGSKIASITRTVSSYGSTENGSFIIHCVDPEDWAYNHINPVYNGMEFRAASINGDEQLYEAVVVKSKDPKMRRHQRIFWSKPELNEWPMGDLFAKHPTKENHWKYEGRVDDMIILDSGHNFHPMFYENEILLKDPNIASAVILGFGRETLSLIVEMAGSVPETDQARARAIEKIWPTVAKCNERSTTIAKIPKERIIIATGEKPLSKGMKGNVQRKMAEAKYKAELDQVYAA